MTHDLTPPAGHRAATASCVSAPRLDNLAPCCAGVAALLGRGRGPTAPTPRPGARALRPRGGRQRRPTAAPQSTLLPARARADRARRAAATARTSCGRWPASSCASADMAHATHPNYADRHEPQHQIAVNGGPVLKVNATCATPPTPAAPPRSRRPASRPACRCSASSTAPTCPAARPSARSPRPASASPPSTSVRPARDALRRELCGRRPRDYTAALAAFLARHAEGAVNATHTRRSSR